MDAAREAMRAARWSFVPRADREHFGYAPISVSGIGSGPLGTWLSIVGNASLYDESELEKFVQIRRRARSTGRAAWVHVGFAYNGRNAKELAQGLLAGLNSRFGRVDPHPTWAYHLVVKENGQPDWDNPLLQTRHLRRLWARELADQDRRHSGHIVSMGEVSCVVEETGNGNALQRRCILRRSSRFDMNGGPRLGSAVTYMPLEDRTYNGMSLAEFPLLTDSCPARFRESA